MKIVLTLFMLVVPQYLFAGVQNPCSHGSLVDQLGCVDSLYERSEADLNKTYDVLIHQRKSDSEFVGGLRDSENSWIFYRGSDCELISYSTLRRMHLVLAQAICTAHFNQQRLEILRGLMSKQTPVSTDACRSMTGEDRTNCLQDLLQSAETHLNQTYQQILAKLESSQSFGNDANFTYENMASRLRISQRSWLYYRTSQCNFDSISRFSVQDTSVSQLSCTAKMDSERIKFLQETFAPILK